MSQLRYIWRNYSAAIVLTSVALIFMLLQLWTGWKDYIGEQQTHHAAIEVGDYLWLYFNRVFENLQSEAWQVVLAAWVFSIFRWKGTPDSKEAPDEES
jgi:hypothetical protein